MRLLLRSLPTSPRKNQIDKVLDKEFLTLAQTYNAKCAKGVVFLLGGGKKKVGKQNQFKPVTFQCCYG